MSPSLDTVWRQENQHSGKNLQCYRNADYRCGNCIKLIEQNYATLNRMQSIVQPVAMNTNENLLICAPTGAVSLRLLLRYCASSSTEKSTAGFCSPVDLGVEQLTQAG